MIEAYKITTRLDITGNANRLMKQFAMLTAQANKNVKSLLATLKIVSKDFILIKDSLRIINPEFKNLNRTFSTLSPKLNRISGNFDEVALRIKSLIPDVAALRSELNGLSSSGRIRISGGMGGGGGARIARAEGAAIGGFGAGKFMHGAGMGSLVGLGVAGGVGMAAMHGFNQMKTYDQNLNILRFQGFSARQIGNIRSATSSPPTGFSQNDMLQAYVASLMATQNPGMAKALMPQLARSEFIAKSTFGGMSNKQMQNLARVAELRGHGNLNSMHNWLETATQMMALSGGTLQPSEQRAFFKYGQAAIGRISKLGYLSLEPIIQSMGGSTTGVAFRTLGRAASGGFGSNLLTKGQIGWWKSLGLWDDHAKGTKYGAMKANALSTLQTDPVMWVKNFLIPGLQHAGMNTPSQMQASLQHLPGATANVITAMVLQMAKEMRTRSTASRLLGTGQMFGLSMNSPTGAVNSLSAAWNNFTTTLTRTVEPIIIPTLKLLTGVLNSLSSAAHIGVTLNKLQHSTTAELTKFGHEVALPAALNLYIDGRKLAQLITGHQVRGVSAAGTQSSTSSINTGITLIPSSSGYEGLF